jgi:hypothetical protein
MRPVRKTFSKSLAKLSKVSSQAIIPVAPVFLCYPLSPQRDADEILYPGHKG